MSFDLFSQNSKLEYGWHIGPRGRRIILQFARLEGRTKIPLETLS